MSHEQDAELVAAVDDVVVHDSQPRLELVPAHVELVQARNRGIGRAVRVVDGRPIDRLAVALDRERLGDRESLAVADDHAHDVAARHPRSHPGSAARVREADLVARPGLVRVCESRQLLLVRSPTQFRRSDPFLVKALHRPGVDELVLELRLVADLGVALRDVNDLHAERMRQVVPRALVARSGDVVVRLFGKQCVGDVGECRLREMRNEAGVSAVVEDRGRPVVVAPARDAVP